MRLLRAVAAWPLAVKVVLSVALVIVAGNAAATYLLAEDRIATEGERLAAAHDLAFFGLNSRIRRLLVDEGQPITALASDEEIGEWLERSKLLRFELVDTEGMVVYSTEAAETGEASADAEEVRAVLQSGQPIYQLWEYEEEIDAGHPDDAIGLKDLVPGVHMARESWAALRDASGQPVLAVHLYSDMSGAQAAGLAALRSLGLLLGGTTVAGIVVAGVLIYLTVHRRAATLIHTAQLVALGDQRSRAPSMAQDEIGQVAVALNEMLDSLLDWQRKAQTDPLTGLLNHRSLHERLGTLCLAAKSGGRPLGLLMLDLDGFKLFNDTYGHVAGDEVLLHIASVMRKSFRATELIGRYGGDEFMVIMPGTRLQEAQAVAQRFLRDLEASPFCASGGFIPVAASVGVSALGEDVPHKEELIARADAAMYEAKAMGGRRMVVADAPEGAPRVAAFASGFGVLEGLVSAIDKRDQYTKEHSLMVSDLAVALGNQIGLSDEAGRALRIAGLLHDVGKIAVPDAVLKKPGALTAEEFVAIQKHVIVGERLITDVPRLRDVLQAVSCHHERYDGTGYPRGLKGQEIPVVGRIMAVVDAYSAMRLDRPYRSALGEEEARRELVRGKGTQFDPALLDAFLAYLDAEASETEQGQAA